MTETNTRGDRVDDAWRGCLALFLAGCLAVLALTLAFVILIDPYDSGRFPSLGISGVSDTNQRTEHVSLGRSDKFNAAIFSDSHGQLLDPDRLTQSTGLSFVQLSVPGARAPEQLAVMHWFIRHHAHIGALVLAADQIWCVENPQPWHWFPFWLYGDSDTRYLANSLNSRSIGAAWRRVTYVMGLLQPSDPRGYDDYEARRPPGYRFDFPSAPAAAPSAPPPIDLRARAFPAIDRLKAELDAAPAGTSLVVVFPPVYIAALPGDAQSVAELDECKARLARLARGTPHGGFLDYLIDSPLARDQASFQDIDHYRAPVAREIEREIARVLDRRQAGGK
jgi:hypothetical protein